MAVRELLMAVMIGLAAQTAPGTAGASPAAHPPAAKPYVRLAELQIDPAQLAPFRVALHAEIEASVRVEPGVLALYAVALDDDPTQVRVFEMYVDQAAYAAHLATPHFQKFKAETQGMVRALKLLDATPLTLGAKGR